MDGLALVFLIPPLILSAVILTIAGTTGQFAVLLCGALLCIPILGLPLGYLLIRFGFNQAAHGNYKAAESAYSLAIPCMSLFRIGPLSNFQALPTSVLAELFFIRGKYEQAELLYRKNEQMCKASAKTDAHANYRSTMLKDIGVTKFYSKNYDEAFDNLKAAIVVCLNENYAEENTIGLPKDEEQLDDERLVRLAKLTIKSTEPPGPNICRKARTVLYLAAVFRQRGRPDTANELMPSSISLLESNLGPTDPELIYPLVEYALLLRDLGQTEQAVACFHRAKSIAKERLNHKHPHFAFLDSFEHEFQPSEK